MLLAQQLAIEQKQFERLKHDFKYNLSLLRERDAELEKYDLETATLRAELEERAAVASKAAAEGTLRDRQLAEERKRVASLQADVAEAERKQRELDEALGRKTSEAARLQQELDAENYGAAREKSRLARDRIIGARVAAEIRD